MKVIGIGCAGDMGRLAASILVKSDLVKEMVIADIDINAAQRAAEQLGLKASARACDAADETGLAALMAEGDIVVNTCGPFYRFGLPVLRAAIKAKRNYCDINDDWKPTQEMLELDDKAKQAGITAIIGIGASPGISNLLTKHAAQQLEKVDEVQTCWLNDPKIMPEIAAAAVAALSESGQANAALEHLIQGASERIPTFKDGEWIEIDAFDSGVEVKYPGADMITLYPVGHSEPVTLPRFIPGVNTICNLGGLYPPQLNDLVGIQAAKVRNGEMDAGQASLSFLETLADDPQKWLSRPDKPVNDGPWVIASGQKEGRRMRYSCALRFPAFRGNMANRTSIPLATATLAILDGAISRHGAVPPEACIEPLPFFEKIAAICEVPIERSQFLIEDSEWLD